MPVEIPNAILVSGRSAEMVAPEGVFFRPDFDLVGAAFGLSAPAGVYDPRMHDLRYSWTFGDPGVFVAPINLRLEHADRNTATGFEAAHVYRTPGVYTVRLDVTGTVSGAPVEAYSERTVTIGDPATIFGGSRTYFVSPSSNWSQAPAGAQRVTSLDDAAGWSNEDGASGPYRIMLNRNETHSFSGRRFGFNTEAGSTLHVVAGPGSGADPVLICTGGFSVGANSDATFANKTVVFQSLDMVGPYDPVTPSDPDVTSSFSFWGPYSPQQILVDRCEMRGFGHGVYIGEDCPRHIYVSDSVIEGYGQWGLIGGGVDGLYLLGARVQSHVNAPINNAFNMGGPIRLGGRVETFIASAIDGFSRQGWSGAGGGYIATQPVIRVEVDEHAGQRINVTRSSMEGGFTMLSLSRGSASPTLNSVVVNALVEDCYFLGGYQTTSVVGNDLGGLTLRDNVTVIPDTTVRVGPGLAAFLELRHFGSVPVLAAPINVIDNTVVNLTNDEIAVVSNAPGYSAVTVSGTIAHQPALTPPQPSAVPLVTAPPLWTPREIGYRSTTVALVAGTATPAGAAASYAPQAGGEGIEGGLAATLESAALSASGRLSLSASASLILAVAAAAAAGGSRIAGAAAATLAPAAVAVAGGLRIGGASARTLGAMALSASGRLSLSASAAAVLAGASASAAGGLRAVGAAGIALDAAALAAAGSLAALPGSGALGGALAPAGLSAAGRLSLLASASAILAGATASAAGGLRVVGAAGASLDAAVLAAAGVLAPISGGGALGAVLAPAGLSAAGRLSLTGSAAAILAAASVGGAGSLRSVGGLAATLADAAVQARQAAIVGVGGATVTLGPARLEAEIWKRRRPTRTRGRRKPRVSDARR